MGIKYENIYTIYDDYATITISGGKYKGITTKIDLEDVEKCKQYHWCASMYGHKRERYYFSNAKTGIILHRYIMNTPKGMDTDHEDGDSLNSRKYNLRICTRLENARNRKLNIDNKSGHKGVFWDDHIPTPKWVSFIKVKNKYIHLGYFDNFEDAVKVRLEAEEKYFGEFKRVIDYEQLKEK